MEVLSTILTIGTLLYHIISKINENYGSTRSNSNYSNSYNEPTHVLTQNEKLQNMKIEELNNCYATSKITDFTINKAELILSNKQIKEFEIVEVIKQINCIYIKVMHSIPYNSGINDYSTSFSINFIEPTNNIIIYGYKTFNSNEENVFYSISNKIINELSK